MDKKISIKECVGKGYYDFWKCKKRYRVVKGSRGSKKSKTTALWIIKNMMAHEEANTVVIRKTFRTLKDSCFTELNWAINRLCVSPKWHITQSPMEMTYKPTGQKIYFRGLDDPLKITSITVTKGILCWAWIEEAYEITKEDDFDTVNEGIRGKAESGIFKQVTLTFNPWSEHHWLKKRFFDKEDEDVLAMTTTYECNEWLDDADKKLFEKMKEKNPRRYKVAGLGEWGVAEGLVFENYKIEEFEISDILEKENIESAFGLDFGYTNDPTALFCGLVDKINKKIYVFDEVYKKALSNEKIAAEIKRKGYSKEIIIADSAEPKSIDRIKELGINRIRKARKGKDSIKNGIDFIQDFTIIIHPVCKNFLEEISTYTWQTDKNGNTINVPNDCCNHLMDAMRYGMEKISKRETFSFD